MLTYRCPRKSFIALWIANNLVVILKVCDYLGKRHQQPEQYMFQALDFSGRAFICTH